MRDLLKCRGFTRQKTHLIPRKSDPEKQSLFLESYEETKAVNDGSDPILFSDAVHFLHNVHQSWYWSPKGRRPAFKSNTGRSRYNLLGGYSSSSGQYVGVKTENTVNAQNVAEWIDAIEAAFPEAKKMIVSVDDPRYFPAQLATAHLIGKRVQFVFLPPYSPNLNLIERLWKFCKKKVLSIYYGTFKKFMKAVDDFSVTCHSIRMN